jgi:hypothetical protein
MALEAGSGYHLGVDGDGHATLLKLEPLQQGSHIERSRSLCHFAV